jgi:protein gp37
MGKHSKIEWTDHTWNPWFGCEETSTGCLNCYAKRDMNRYHRDFYAVAKAKGFDKPLNWKKPARVFVCSWSDFFIRDADSWRDEAWAIIKKQRHLHFQILTKRPERIMECLPDDWTLADCRGYPNVWLGVTAENQEMANVRIPILLDVPAWTRFVSAEPLLGPINFWKFATREETFGSMYDHRGTYPMYQALGITDSIKYHEGIDWIIVGGESGPNCREMVEEDALFIKDQCVDSGVPFFMKQMSGNTKALREAIPDYLFLRQFPGDDLDE